MSFIQTLDQHEAAGTLPHIFRVHLQQFYESYLESIHLKEPTKKVLELFELFLRFIEEQVAHPHPFAPYHRSLREPVDYYRFGLECIGGVLDRQASTFAGETEAQQMTEQIAAGENVILLGNHQTEPDPQLIDLLLGDKFPQLGHDLIFVAGERVLTDPMAIPFSLGRNLLCVFSRKYIERDAEKRAEKLAHNATTMRTMAKLFHEGGQTGGDGPPAPR